MKWPPIRMLLLIAGTINFSKKISPSPRTVCPFKHSLKFHSDTRLTCHSEKVVLLVAGVRRRGGHFRMVEILCRRGGQGDTVSV